MSEISVDMGQLSPRERYVLLRDSILPRPIAWVSTMNEEGGTNIAPFSFFNVVSPNPPILGFSVGPYNDNFEGKDLPPKDTLANIRATREFVVNIVPEYLLDVMVKTAEPLPSSSSEFEQMSLPAVSSTHVRPPRVAGVPIAFECLLYEMLPVGLHHWIMGEIIHVHIQNEVALGVVHETAYRVDLLQNHTLRPVGRLDRARYVLMEAVVVRQRGNG